jgi:hypothetical protein
MPSFLRKPAQLSRQFAPRESQIDQEKSEFFFCKRGLFTFRQSAHGCFRLRCPQSPALLRNISTVRKDTVTLQCVFASEQVI